MITFSICNFSKNNKIDLTAIKIENQKRLKDFQSSFKSKRKTKSFSKNDFAVYQNLFKLKYQNTSFKEKLSKNEPIFFDFKDEYFLKDERIKDKIFYQKFKNTFPRPPIQIPRNEPKDVERLFDKIKIKDEKDIGKDQKFGSSFQQEM